MTAMIVISIVAYLGLAAAFLFLDDKRYQDIALASTILSSIWAFICLLDKAVIGIIIYMVLGLIAACFYAMEKDEDAQKKKNKATKPKDKTLAVCLAFTLGTFGVHKFYLGKSTPAAFYILFWWTFIPTVISIMEAIFLLTSEQNAFDSKYNSNVDPNALAKPAASAQPTAQKNLMGQFANTVAQAAPAQPNQYYGAPVNYAQPVANPAINYAQPPVNYGQPVAYPAASFAQPTANFVQPPVAQTAAPEPFVEEEDDEKVYYRNIKLNSRSGVAKPCPGVANVEGTLENFSIDVIIDGEEKKSFNVKYGNISLN